MDEINDKLEDFKLLLTDEEKKTKSYEDIQGFIDYFFVKAEANDKDIKKVSELLLDGDTTIIEYFFKNDWSRVDNDVKNIIVGQLIKLTQEKGVLRQAIAAQNIADTDEENSAQVAFYIVNNGEDKFDGKLPSLPKYREEIIKRFFLSAENGWIKLEAANSQMQKALLLYFTKAAKENKSFVSGKNLGFAHNFAKWAIQSLSRVDLDIDSEQSVNSSLKQIINKLPNSSQDELKRMLKSEGTGHENTLNKETEDLQKNEKEKKNDNAEDGKSIKPYDETLQNKNLDKKIRTKSKNTVKKTITTPEDLIKQKEQHKSKLSDEIDILSRLILERDLLKDEVESAKGKFYAAADEIEELDKLKEKSLNKISKLEKDIAQTISVRDKLLSNEKNLKADLKSAQDELDNKSKTIREERDEFSDSSNRKAKNEVEVFKGKLKQKLRPIFENKRQTDEKPDSENLSRFLRRWFNHIEEVLNNSDIKP